MPVINKDIIIKVGSQQVTYYKSLGYENVKFRSELLINVNDLPSKSMVIVDVICDNCKKISTTRYQDYNKLINKHNNYYCKLCKGKRISETNIYRYDVVNVSQLESVKNKKIDKFLLNYGCVHPMKNKEVKNRMMQTHIDNFGCHYTQTKEHRIFIHDFIIDMYGVGNSFLNIETMILKYGVEHPSKSIEIMCNRNITNLNRYGNICSLHGLEQKIKTRNTIYDKYGVYNIFESEFIKDKIKNTVYDKYGVYNVSKVPSIHRKKIKTAFKVNNFKDLSYQGSYEKDFLNRYHEQIDIEDGPSVNYIHEGFEHVYHSDFYLSKYNLIIEIKSSYFYLMELTKNLSKRRKCIENGYNFLFIVDKNYDKLIDIIKK